MANVDLSAREAEKGVRALVAWAVEANTRELPDPVMVRAIRVLFDDLAAIIGARNEPEVAAFHQRVLARANRQEATVFRGGRPRTDRMSAAVANAVAADWLEVDEGYRVTPCHAGLYVVPALLATAEVHDLPLRDMLRALALAYEIVTRVARTWHPSVMVQHSHARYAAVGACASTALAAQVPAPIMHAALTGAATLVSAGPRSHLVSGALVRNVWPAVGAWAGMMSVEWAECGIAGAADGLHDVYSTVLRSEERPEFLTQGLGERYAIMDGYTKIFACCQHLHSAVEATLGMRDEILQDGPLEAIAAIEVATHPLAMSLVNPRPTTTLGAKFSLPHAVAAAVISGTGGADAFRSTTLDDPAIARLRERVRPGAFAPLPEPPNDRPARVTVRLENGRVIVGECLSAQGGSDRPFASSVLIDKVRGLTADAYPNLVGIFNELLRLDPSRMEQRWGALVGEICA